MSRVEERLQDAAAETRQATRRAVPPGIGHSPMRARTGWLVFAAAFAAVVVLVGAIPILTGPGEEDPVSTQPLTEPTEPIAEPTEPPVTDCSAAGMDMPTHLPELPAAVAETRDAIAAVAIACDFAALAELGGSDLNTSFGGGGVDNLEMWEAEGRNPLAVLVTVLDLSHAVVEVADGPDIHVWPAAHVYDSWEDIPPQLVDELLAIHGPDDLASFAQFGSYAGWRVGINEEGRWLFFVTGD